jgi:multicomponent K+:H+ antiporter subunit D
MVVFAVKAALFPVQFWLPATYANAPAPVAALFAIMTKVGAYAILRVHTTAFGPGIPGTEGLAGTWLFPAAIVTIAVGAFGVLGARRLMPLIAFSVVGSMGTLLVAVAAFSTTATSAALYYMVHSTFAAACLFLIADLVVTRRSADTLRAEPATVQNGLFAALFFAAAIAMAGMPPLSGFLGKLLVLDARARRGDRLGLVRDPDRLAPDHRRFRAGGQRPVLEIHRDPVPARTRSGRGRHRRHSAARHRGAGRAVMLTLAMLALLAVFAGPVSAYLDDTSAQLFDREGYVDAVLGPGRGGLSHADTSSSPIRS